MTIDLCACQTGLDRKTATDRLLRAFWLEDAEGHVPDRDLRSPVKDLAAL